ncbi:WYL domain-containing protein [Vibrio apostichopi]
MNLNYLFHHHYVHVAWCETRKAFRNFRLDRISKWPPSTERYLSSRHA